MALMDYDSFGPNFPGLAKCHWSRNLKKKQLFDYQFIFGWISSNLQMLKPEIEIGVW